MTPEERTQLLDRIKEMTDQAEIRYEGVAEILDEAYDTIKADGVTLELLRDSIASEELSRASRKDTP